MAPERSLVFIKWPSVESHEEIFFYLDRRLSEAGKQFKRTENRKFVLPEKVIAEHYAHVRELNADAYADYISTFQRYPISARVYSGEDGLCLAIRKIVGATDPTKAEFGTIRRLFYADSIERAVAERRAVRNVIHASGNSQEAEIEIKRFAPYFGELSYILSS